MDVLRVTSMLWSAINERAVSTAEISLNKFAPRVATDQFVENIVMVREETRNATPSAEASSTRIGRCRRTDHFSSRCARRYPRPGIHGRCRDGDGIDIEFTSQAPGTDIAAGTSATASIG